MINFLSLTISSILTFVLVAFLTIYSELNETFKQNLASFTGHLWISKSIITVIAFIVFYLIFSIFLRNNKIKAIKSVYLIIVFAILTYITIFSFFLYEYLIK